MTFKVSFDTFPVEFPEGPEGLEVIGRMVSIGRYFESLDLDGTPMIEWFIANGLVSWNLELNGEPVPMTVEGMLSLPRWLVARIVRRWQRGVATVGAPLAQPSPDGVPSPGLNLPMEVLSTNPES